MGCNSKHYYREKLSETFNLHVSNNFKVINHSSDFSTTSDYHETFGLQFSPQEFNNIFKLIKPKRAIADTNFYYYEINDENSLANLTFDSSRNIVYYTLIEE